MSSLRIPLRAWVVLWSCGKFQFQASGPSERKHGLSADIGAYKTLRNIGASRVSSM